MGCLIDVLTPRFTAMSSVPEASPSVLPDSRSSRAKAFLSTKSAAAARPESRTMAADAKVSPKRSLRDELPLMVQAVDPIGWRPEDRSFFGVPGV